MYQKSQSYNVQFLRWHFLLFWVKMIDFRKMRKKNNTCGDIIILYKCTKNHICYHKVGTWWGVKKWNSVYIGHVAKLKLGWHVQKEYEVKIKMNQEQWLLLKMKPLLGYNNKMFIFWGEPFEGGYKFGGKSLLGWFFLIGGCTNLGGHPHKWDNLSQKSKDLSKTWKILH